MTLPSQRKLFPVVRDWFTETRGCRFAFVRGDGHMQMSVGVLKPLDEEDESRWLDVLAYELTPFASQYVVHIAQAAPLYQAEGWPALLAKEVEVRQFADYQWVFMSFRNWNALTPAQQVDVELQIRTQEIGLLLAHKGGCEVRIAAPPNTVREASGVRALLRNPAVVADTLVPGIPALSHADGRVARQIAATAWDIQALLTPALEPVAGGPVTWSVAHDTTRVRPFFISNARCGRELLDLFVDPFGTYSDDGVPVVWVFKRVAHAVGSPMPEFHPLATHWITGRGDELGPVFLIRDLEAGELAALERHGYEELEFGRRIEILARRKRDIVRDVVETFVAFRAGKPLLPPPPPMAQLLRSWVPKRVLPPRLEPVDNQGGDQAPAVKDVSGVSGVNGVNGVNGVRGSDGGKGEGD